MIKVNLSMNLDSIYFNLIKNKKKLYETRVLDEKRKKINLLDVVEFKERGTNRTFNGVITELSYFSNFKEAIIDCGLKKVMPNARSIDDAVTLYENFPHVEGNYKKAAKKNGVLRMKFQLI
tara:strand:- start:51 stop:413 length:363 start_codon:yes stop_codon:yes gene_type:complete